MGSPGSVYDKPSSPEYPALFERTDGTITFRVEAFERADNFEADSLEEFTLGNGASGGAGGKMKKIVAQNINTALMHESHAGTFSRGRKNMRLTIFHSGTLRGMRLKIPLLYTCGCTHIVDERVPVR